MEMEAMTLATSRTYRAVMAGLLTMVLCEKVEWKSFLEFNVPRRFGTEHRPGGANRARGSERVRGVDWAPGGNSARRWESSTGGRPARGRNGARGGEQAFRSDGTRRGELELPVNRTRARAVHTHDHGAREQRGRRFVQVLIDQVDNLFFQICGVIEPRELKALQGRNRRLQEKLVWQVFASGHGFLLNRAGECAGDAIIFSTLSTTMSILADNNIRTLYDCTVLYQVLNTRRTRNYVQRMLE